MALTKEKRRALIKWLESMPWWEELPYVQFEADLVERTHQYHLAHAKILSREAINQTLADDYLKLNTENERLQKRIVALEANVSKSVLRRLDAQLEVEKGNG